MRIQYCDRCGVELKVGKQSSYVRGIADADEDGNGKATDAADLCVPCYRAFAAWLKGSKGK